MAAPAGVALVLFALGMLPATGAGRAGRRGAPGGDARPPPVARRLAVLWVLRQ